MKEILLKCKTKNLRGDIYIYTNNIRVLCVTYDKQRQKFGRMTLPVIKARPIVRSQWVAWQIKKNFLATGHDWKQCSRLPCL